jgi:hypothetical protein
MKTRMPTLVFLASLMCLLGGPVFVPQPGAEGAQPLPTDVGLITQLSGNATYWNEASPETPKPAQIYMKIRTGDHLSVTSGALLQVVYFQSGRKETWRGPATIIVGEAESRVKEEKGIQAQAEAMILPAEASQGLRHIPGLLDRARLSRSGVTSLRGPEESAKKAVAPGRQAQMEIARAQETYRKWREQTSPDDITPELNLLGMLGEYQQYQEMEKVIQEALKRQPDNEVLKELGEWVVMKMKK